MYQYAKEGKEFVLTEKGYEATPDEVRPERYIGQPIKDFSVYENHVPMSWIKKGYVKEQAESVHDKLTKFQQEVSTKDTDRDAKQHDHRREDREER